MSAPTILNVGNGQQYKTIAAAITAANSISGGVVIQVTAGTYFNDGGWIKNDDVTVEGVGGIAKLVGASAAAGGGAAIIASGTNVDLTNLDISGVAAGAGIVVKSDSASINDVHVHDNQIGIWTVGNSAARVIIEASEVDHNVENINVGGSSSLEVSFSAVHDAQGGNEIESRALQNFFIADSITDNASPSAYPIDLPLGGYAGFNSTFIEKGPNSTTNSFISSGSESFSYPDSSIWLNTSTLINDNFPATQTLLERPTGLHVEGSLTWNLANLGSIAAGSTTYQALASRPSPTGALPEYLNTPMLGFITGNRDGGITISGKFQPGWSVTVADTVGGQTTLLGTAIGGNGGHFALTSHAKIDPTTIHTYTISGASPYGSVFSAPNALILTDTGVDHLTSTAGAANVFAIMSFKGSDIIDGFKTSTAAGYLHDAIDFSGRGITSFAQVQAMMSGSGSTVLTVATGKTVTLTGISPTTLSAGDFVFS